jgi:hypothetical protein
MPSNHTTMIHFKHYLSMLRATLIFLESKYNLSFCLLGGGGIGEKGWSVYIIWQEG